MQHINILLIDDDPQTAIECELFLKAVGCSVSVANSAESGKKIYFSQDVDIVLLELNLPDLAGEIFLQELRESGSRTPVVVFTSNKDLERKLLSLRIGADDFVFKDVQREELIARVHAVYRRANIKKVNLIRAGELEIDITVRKVEVSGQIVELTWTEFEVLQLLAERKGRPVSKTFIFDRLYHAKDPPKQKIVDVFLCNLRKKLSLPPHKTNPIETVMGVGYRLRDMHS